MTMAVWARLTRTATSGAALGAVLLACAAGRKAGEPPAAAPASEATAPSTPASYGQPGYPAQADAKKTDGDQPGPPPPPSAAQPSTTPGGGSYATPPNRTAAMNQALNEVDASQRELDVAGGDCRNACRALGSMDRAAGRLCGLAQSNDEQRRCGDAKNRVYSARDKVRNTCGSCPDVSVDRSAPIPSR